MIMIQAGNIQGTPDYLIIRIFDHNTDDEIIPVVMPDDTQHNNTVMSDHYLQFSFNHIEKISFKRCDYIKHNDVVYALRKDYEPTQDELNGIKYDLKLEAPEMFWQDVIMFYTMQGYDEVGWVLYGNARQFLKIGVENINTQLNENWKVGIVDIGDNVLKNINFSSAYVFDSFTEIAEQFECEWYVDYKLKTVNLVSKYEHGDEVVLEREVQLKDIVPSENTQLEYCNRLYAYGSIRNITNNYRKIGEDETIDAIVQKKLRMPVSVGDYIDAVPDLKPGEVIPRVVSFDVYPKRIGKITSLRTVEKKGEDGKPFIIFYFKDKDLKFRKDYILPDEDLMLQFGENSWLNGRDFELKCHEKKQGEDIEIEFEIINKQEGENSVPNSLITPKIGDEYTLYNFDIDLVGDQYISEAEQELYDKAKEYLDTLQKNNKTYACPVNPVHRFEYDLDLQLGQKVKLKSLIFDAGSYSSRVYGYKKMLVTGKDEYTIGDDADYKRLARIENEVEQNKKEADVQYLEAMKLANGTLKNVKALNYIRTALENETTIDKGLLLTTLIRLGAVMGNEWIERAGINGGAVSEDDVVAYFGGSLDDAVEGLASIVFRLDGSGYLAKRNIEWNAKGNTVYKGILRVTDEDGNVIEIDISKRSISMYSKQGNQMLDMSYMYKGNVDNPDTFSYWKSIMKMKSYQYDGERKFIYPLAATYTLPGMTYYVYCGPHPDFGRRNTVSRYVEYYAGGFSMYQCVDIVDDNGFLWGTFKYSSLWIDGTKTGETVIPVELEEFEKYILS